MSLTEILRDLRKQAATQSNGLMRMPMADALRALDAGYIGPYTVHRAPNGKPQVITVAVELRIPVE